MLPYSQQLDEQTQQSFIRQIHSMQDPKLAPHGKPSPKKFHSISGVSYSLEYEVREHTCDGALLSYFRVSCLHVLHITLGLIHVAFITGTGQSGSTKHLPRDGQHARNHKGSARRLEHNRGHVHMPLVSGLAHSNRVASQLGCIPIWLRRFRICLRWHFF